jgi:hypothetical protein
MSGKSDENDGTHVFGVTDGYVKLSVSVITLEIGSAPRDAIESRRWIECYIEYLLGIFGHVHPKCFTSKYLGLHNSSRQSRRHMGSET